MKILKKLPGQPWHHAEIDNTLEALQQEVGGYIETVTIAPDACFVCNEEGRLLNLPYNATICGVQFVGPLLLVGVNEDEFTDVPDACSDLFAKAVTP